MQEGEGKKEADTESTAGSRPANPLHLFHPSSYTPPLWQLPVCFLYSGRFGFLFFVLFILFF